MHFAGSGRIAIRPRRHRRGVWQYALSCATGGILAGLLCMVSFATCAEEILPDPIRQPAELSMSAASAVQAPSPRKIDLQSVIISPAYRAAIINGQLVKTGEMVGDATLVEVKEGKVVLQSAQGRQVLTLFPGVEIKKKETLQPGIKEAAPVVKKKLTGKKKRTGKSVGHAVQSKKIEGGKK